MIKPKAGSVSGIISAAILLVYLCFPTRVYYWDGVAFAQAIEDAPALGASLIHPNHLLYEVFGYLVFTTVRGLGIDVRALTVLQVLSSVLSAAAALLLFHILWLAVGSLYLCSVLTLLFAFSATWWRFSTDANAYVPSVLFILISFYFTLPGRRPRPWLLAWTFSLSVWMHQLGVVFFLVLLLGLFFQTSALAARQRALTALKFSVTAFVLTFGAYYCCFYLAAPALGFKSLMRWMTFFSPDAGFSFDLRRNLAFTLRGYARLFFGGRVNALEDLYHPIVVALLIILAALALLFVLTLIRHSKGLKLRWGRALNYDSSLKPVLLLCAIWIVGYTAFLFVWLPHNTFYRLFYHPALVVLAGLLLSSGERFKPPPRTYGTALFVAGMSVANFLFLIFPASHVQKYPPLALALDMNGVWPRGTVVYYGSISSDVMLFRYFNPQAAWKQLRSVEAKVLESELQSIHDQGGAAWLDVTAIDQFSSTTEAARWLALHVREQSWREIRDPAYKIKFVQMVP